MVDVDIMLKFIIGAVATTKIIAVVIVVELVVAITTKITAAVTVVVVVMGVIKVEIIVNDGN